MKKDKNKKGENLSGDHIMIPLNFGSDCKSEAHDEPKKVQKKQPSTKWLVQ